MSRATLAIQSLLDETARHETHGWISARIRSAELHILNRAMARVREAEAAPVIGEHLSLVPEGGRPPSRIQRLNKQYEEELRPE